MAVKVNGNFPHNATRFGLPTIQGVIVLCDVENGFPLAVMDSIALLAVSKVVVDILGQSATMGELHHALKQGAMTTGDVYAELGEVIVGRKPGRTSPHDVVVFDSTGTALQDVAAASIVYEKAVRDGKGKVLQFSG